LKVLDKRSFTDETHQIKRAKFISDNFLALPHYAERTFEIAPFRSGHDESQEAAGAALFKHFRRQIYTGDSGAILTSVGDENPTHHRSAFSSYRN
jgi:hypothetical protein